MSPPNGPDWVHEIKYDGYRTLCHVERGRVHFFTRSMLDWSERYRQLIPYLKKLDISSAWFDGEIVVLNQKGVSQFQLLQKSLKDGEKNLIYYIFDLLEWNGSDLRDLPLFERKIRLQEILPKHKGPLRFSEDFEGEGASFLEECCQLGLEGIVSKNKNATYVSSRSTNWIKIKCNRGHEFIIIGYTEPKTGTTGFGSLLLGAYNEQRELKYAGKAGTGFNQNTILDLMKKLKKIEEKTSPVVDFPLSERGIHWVKPKLVCEVQYSEKTMSGVLRHPSFKGLRRESK